VAQLNGLRASIERERLKDVEEYNTSKLADLKRYLSSIVSEARAQVGLLVGSDEQQVPDHKLSDEEVLRLVSEEAAQHQILETKQEEARKEIVRKYTEFEESIDNFFEETVNEVKNQVEEPDEEGIVGVINTVRGMMSGYNTLESARMQWRDMLLVDHIIHESTGEYAIKSGKGYFPNQKVPAFQFLRVLELFSYSAIARSTEDRKKIIKETNKQFEDAWWEGVDANSKELKKDFIVLRRDRDAYSADSYNEKLSHVIETCEGLFAHCPKHEPVLQNIYAAIMNLAVVCSVPDEAPFHISRQEQAKSMRSTKRCLSFIKQELRVR